MSSTERFHKEWVRTRRNMDKARRRIRRLSRDPHLRLLLLAAIVGVAAGFGAVAVRLGIAGVEHVFWGSEDLLAAARNKPWWLVMLPPALGGLLVGPIVWIFSRDDAGHGVAEVMESLLMRGGRIRGRVAVVKGTSAAITLGSGGSAGREGPMIQVGASLGSVVGQIFGLGEDGMRTLVAAGAGGGLAAAFNAPIAGSLFALEVVLGDFGISSFTPVFMAGIAATAIVRAVFGTAGEFAIPTYTLKSAWEFMPYAVLGLAAGFVAVGFTLFLYGQERVWEKLKAPVWFKPAVGGLVVGTVGIFFPQILGTGHAPMDAMLHGAFPVGLLIALIFVKIAATSFTLGSGGTGGVFVPSLFVGAALGGAVGDVVARWAPFAHGSPAAYALVGMGAVVAATSHAPLTGMMIMVELTGDYEIILPVMLACILSSVVASSLKEESIYTQKLKWRGISLRKGREESILEHLSVRSILRKDFRSFAENAPLPGVLTQALGSTQNTFPVVGSEGELVGVIRVQDLHQALDDRSALESVLMAADLAEETRALRTEDNVEQALQMLTATNADLLPVVDARDVVVGVVLAADVMERYSRELQKLRLAHTLAGKRSFKFETQGMELGYGMRLAEVPVPEKLAGRTLRDLNLRQEFGVEVLYVLRAPYRVPTFTNPSLVLQLGDRMVIVAEAESLRKFEERTGSRATESSHSN